MLDEKMLERMTLGELQRGLEYLLETIKGLEADLPEGEDDPRIDPLYSFGDKIIKRMDSLIREPGRADPDALAQWTTFVREYEQDFEKFTDTILADDTILPLDADADADDARTESLIEKGNLLIEELDPTVRERCKDDPAALAEWDAIMHSCDDPKEESPDHDADAS